MKDVIIHIEHPNVDHISDRSARQILKRLSISIRRAQSDSLRDFIFDLDIAYRSKKSLWDKMTNALQERPSYNLVELRKGSLILTAIVSTGVLAHFYIMMMDHFEDASDRALFSKIFKKHIKAKWPESISEKTADDLKSSGIGARMLVKRCKTRRAKNHITLDVVAETDPDFRETLERPCVQTAQDLKDLIDEKS